MPDQDRMGLDNTAFEGRLRQRPNLSASQDGLPESSPSRRIISDVEHPQSLAKQPQQPVKARASFIQDSSPEVAVPPAINETTASTVPPFTVTRPQPFAVPAQHRQQPSSVLQRTVQRPVIAASAAGKKTWRELSALRRSKTQIALVSMATCVFAVGLLVSLQTAQTNHNATAEVAALAQSSQKNSSNLPSEDKPSAQAVRNYVVAADLARYIKIPKLNVNARVLQVGVTSQGALDTPNNIYDTAWYTGSAKPGQPGATVIDGHVSGWTSHGVFYGLKNLVANDKIQIVRGDGTVLNYHVVAVKVYPANKVDMNAAVNPVVAGTSGLNLITCDGQVQSGTSQYSERVIVFTELNN